MPHDLKLWCEDCQKGYDGACTEHGPLTHVSDTEIGTRARRSLPQILELREENNQIGIYAKSALAKRLQFGPLQGICKKESLSKETQIETLIKARVNIVFKLVTENSDLLLINTLHEDQSNWMIFVRAAEHKSEQNLVAFQYKGEIFFATIKEVPAKTELKVWYSKDYAEQLGANILSGDIAPWQFRTRLKFICPNCNILFSSTSSLSNHRCQKITKSKKETVLRARKGKRVSRIRTSLSPTLETPSTSQVVTRARRTPTKEKSSSLPELFVSSESEEESRVRTGKSLPFKCAVCQKQFQSPGKLRQHSISHSGEKPFVCSLCQKSFSSRFKLGRHELIHTSERQHQCPLCDRSFRRKDHLKNHIQIHDPNKQFKCEKPDCGKEYSSFMSYKKHCAIHSAEEGDLECKICSDMFDNKEELIYHLKVHVGAKTVKSPTEKKFKCDHCERKFFTRKDVKRHLVVHTGKRDFVCNLCPQKFGRKDHLVRHIKKSHGSMEPPKVEFDPSVPGPSRATPPEVGLTSSTSSEHSFSPLLVTEDFSSTEPSSLSAVEMSSLTHPELYGTRSFSTEMKYFEGVKEDPDLSASVEGLSSNNDDLFKLLGMYLPASSITTPVLDPETTGQEEPVQQSILLEPSSLYQSGIDPLIPMTRILPVSSSSILEYTDAPSLPQRLALGEHFVETTTLVTTTTTVTTTTSLPGFDQAFP